MEKAISKQRLLLKYLAQPNKWQKGLYNEKLAENLEALFKTKVFPLNGGRSALYVGLKSLGIGSGDEVILQAYTCNAVPNSILWTGATPVYADIEEETLNLGLGDFEKKITERSKAVIVQHTFGNPAKIKDILRLAEKHRLKVIEDCAHSLGVRTEGKLVGTFGDLGVLSFGREKIISALSGGALLVNDPDLIPKVEEQVKTLKPLSKRRITQELANFFAWRTVFRPIYTREWGHKFVRFLYQFDLVNVVTAAKELVGQKPGWYPSLMPNIFAHIALIELDKFVECNLRRNQIASSYFEKITNKEVKIIKNDGVYLRVVGLHQKAPRILEEAAKLKLQFGNWYDAVVYPDSVQLSRLGYKSGSCPVAEKTALQTFNLPNYIGMTDKEVEKVASFINDFR